MPFRVDMYTNYVIVGELGGSIRGRSHEEIQLSSIESRMYSRDRIAAAVL